MHAVPLDKLLDKTRSIYKLVILASRRTIELAEGGQKLTDAPSDAKPANIAIKEILDGKIEYKDGEKK